MKMITNMGTRRLGVPGRPAIILNAKESVPLDDAQEAEIRKNRTVARWLESGTLVISDGVPNQYEAKQEAVKPVRRPTGIRPTGIKKDDRKEEPLPDGLTGEGVEKHHLGGGWYEVYVNGFKVTDKNIRKDEAKALAKEYE